VEKKNVGSIVVTERGAVVLLTAIEVVGEMRSDGRVPIFDSGIVLRGDLRVGSQCVIPINEGVRVVGNAGELVRLLEGTGVDLTTRPERPLSSLSPAERIERLERENAELKSRKAQ